MPNTNLTSLCVVETSPESTFMAASGALKELVSFEEDLVVPRRLKVLGAQTPLERQAQEDSRDAVLPPTIDRESLYRDFQPLVRRLIRQYGDTPELRQDLSGEIYYRFCLLLDAFDPSRGIPLRPYLVRQLTASVYTYARHGWRRNRREVSLDLSDGAYDKSQSEDPSREWDERLAMGQVLQSLPDAIARLPKRQRQVVIWRYYEQRSFDEISELLSIQLATARSLLRHGLNNLRRQMASNYPNWE
jgi:RNA polymerase sigma factor (sigma-70 family)